MENKKSNKKAWIIVIVIVLILVILGAIGMIVFNNGPEKTVDEIFKKLKEGDIASLNDSSVSEITSLGESVAGEEENLSPEKEEELVKACFSQLEWKITGCEENGDTAVVSVEVTNKDFSTFMSDVFSEIFNQALSSALTEDAMTEDKMIDLMIEKLNAITGTKTVTDDLDLVKEDGIWKLDDSDIENVLLPGLMEGVSSFMNSNFSVDDDSTDYSDSGL